MSDIDFDDNGNPCPYELMDLRLEGFHNKFVEGFPASSTRQEIYESYLTYVSDFYKEIINEWLQWIDGSFTTNKADPHDIDLVSLIKAEALSEKYTEINKFLTKYGSKDRYKVDGYCIPVYAESDERYAVTLEQVKYWQKWFGQDRKKNPKGIIQLTFNDDIVGTLNHTEATQ